MTFKNEDTIELFASIKNREMLSEMRQKLARRNIRNGHRLAAAFAALAIVCALALYGQSLQPKAPVHKTADQHALDELFKHLPSR